MDRPTPGTLKAIQALKREMILLRKAVWPLREVVGNLSRTDSPLIRKLSVLYFRDIYDHTVQVIDTIETCRDILSGMLDIYLSTINNRMNEIMKVLTVIATLFMPLTFLAGVYGMNFKYMPELEWPWGYFALWGVMLVIAFVMLCYFRRKKWL
jgi:magnesium transporter